MWIARTCALLVALIGLLSLSEYLFGWELGIDELLVHDGGAQRQPFHPGRPSPGTALNFALLGAALLTMDVETRGGRWPAQWLVLAVFLDGFVALLGYAYGVESLYRMFVYTSMALHTAVLFVAIPIGFLLARPGRGLIGLATGHDAGGELARRLLPAALVVAPALGALCVAAERAGWYAFEFGLALLAASNVLVFSGLVWSTARSVRSADAERRKAERALHATEERFHLLVDTVTDYAIFLLDRQGNVESWTRAAQRIKGYRPEEIVGRNFSCLYTAEDRQVGKPEQALHLAEAHGRHEEEAWRVRKDGSRFLADVVVSALRDSKGSLTGFAEITRDITERKRMEARFRATVESAPMAMVMTDAGGAIVLLNAQAEKLFGYARHELLGSPVETLVPERFRGEHWEMRGRFFTAPDARVMGAGRNLFCLRKDGQEIPVEIGLSLVETEQDRFVLSAILDITERKRMEAEAREYTLRLAHQADELKRANEALERSNMELRQFAYVASHDLQTPLRNISGFVQLLKMKYEHQLDEQADDWIRRTIRASERMHTLIRELLEYSRVDARARPFEPVRFREVFEDTVAMLAASIQDSAGEVTCDELPTVMGDRAQLVQLMQNLVGNGLKYHAKEPPRVHVSAQREGSDWIFSVRDNGIGIPTKQHERIFEIFRRLHDQQQYPGTGIGLAICRRVVDRHGGRIWVESEPGRGSDFRFTIPFHTIDEKRARQVNTAALENH